ncbi:MAG TPA: lipid II flippase MurJ [Bacillota bacterium]|nr:lipid II flippase MurJ [Bacillota bacterium]
MNNLRRVTVVIVFLSIIVKLLGFLRESIIASQFGANEMTDGYLLAFSFITLIVVMTTAGFNNVFLPMYIRNFKRDPENADKNAVGILNVTTILFIVLGLLLYVLSPYIFQIILVQDAHETGVVATEIMRIYALFLTVIAIDGVLESYLQSKRNFIPIQLSKLSVGFFSAVAPLFLGTTFGINSIAYGFIFGSVLGIIIQFVYLAKDNFKWYLNFKVDRDFSKEFIVLLIPAILNATMGFTNQLVDKLFATSTTTSGAVTYLNNSSLIVSIPYAIFSTTIASIIFTMLSENADIKDKFRKTLNDGLDISFTIFFPICFGMLVIAEPLVSFIFERGAFESEDTRRTFLALLFYSPIVITQGVQLVISKALYAKQRTQLILKISMTTIILNVILNAAFIKPFGYLGLAAASSIVSIYYLVSTTFFLYKDVGNTYLKPVIHFMVRTIIATLGMAVPLYFLAQTEWVKSFYSLTQMAIIVPLGVVLYVISTYIFHKEGFKQALVFIKR